jgi:hypothetical protein
MGPISGYIGGTSNAPVFDLAARVAYPPVARSDLDAGHASGRRRGNLHEVREDAHRVQGHALMKLFRYKRHYAGGYSETIEIWCKDRAEFEERLRGFNRQAMDLYYFEEA